MASKKDKILLKSSALTMADHIIADLGIPGLNLAWGLSKALFGAGMKLRQQRVIEWAEMIRDNPTIFAEVFKEEEFQDGFVFMLENYLRERSEKKRKVLRSVFLNFSKIQDKSTFALEKLVHTASILSEKDILVLKDVNITKDRDRNYQVYGNTEINIDNIFNLVNAGILISDPGSRLGPVVAPYVRVTNFGKEFIKYIKE